MDNIIQVAGLHKSYGHIQAVKGIDFSVRKGELFAFLGPNGAGKSTTIDIICGFLAPDGGEVTVGGYTLGREDDRIRRIIGAVFQDGLLDPLLTVSENIKTRGSMYGLSGAALSKAAEAAVSAVGASDFADRRYGQLSGGQRRRADIARALVNRPDVLFLDEPTTGLDPQTRRNVWSTVDRLRRESDTTIFLTTHYMEEAAAADYVVIIDDGRIAAQGTPASLKEKYSADRLMLVCRDIEAVRRVLDGTRLSCRFFADTAEVLVPSTMDALPVIESCREYINGFEVMKGTMDDAFITVTGKEIRE